MSNITAPLAPVIVRTIEDDEFHVRRIFCVGKNYADHVAEMGGDASRDAPVFFTKPRDGVAFEESEIAYPGQTEDLHFEGELVVALNGGGAKMSPQEGARCVYGCACGCDLTRRDLQSLAKKAGNPWDMAKAFDKSAPIGKIMPRERAGALEEMALATLVNNEQKQHSTLAKMIWSVPEIISMLSRLVTLAAGDLIFTGTPEGVGPLVVGDNVRVEIGPLPPLSFKVI